MVFLPNGELKGRKVIFDTCILGSPSNMNGRSLAFYLHRRDMDRLASITIDFTEGVLQRVGVISRLLSGNNSIILEEVSREHEKLVEMLQAHYFSFVGKLHSGEGKNYSHNIRNFERIKNSLEGLQIEMRKYQRPINWGGACYEDLLAESQEIFAGMISNRMEDADSERKLVGDSLMTAQKLAAYSFLSSYRHPTTLVTANKSLIELVSLLNDSISIPLNQRKTPCTHLRREASDLVVFNSYTGYQKRI